MEQIAQLVDSWGMPVAESSALVDIWTLHHPLLPRPRRTGPATPPPAHGRWRRLPSAAPHTDQTLEATLGERSCLPWKLGEMITT
jgi:hypothetical protein